MVAGLFFKIALGTRVQDREQKRTNGTEKRKQFFFNSRMKKNREREERKNMSDA